MSRQTIRVRYTNGVFTPLEPVELSEGYEVSVDVFDGAEAAQTVESDDPLAGLERYPAYVQRILRLRATLPDDAFDGLPADWSRNKKHYLYGHPKEDDG